MRGVDLRSNRHRGNIYAGVIDMIRTWYGAGLIAGLAVFLWGGLAHLVLGLGGESTFKQVPNEAQAAIAAHVKEGGLYIFPFTKDMNAMAKAIETQPYGLMVFTLAGVPMNMGARMGVQAVGDILACLLAACLFTCALPSLTSFVSRVGFVMGLGVFSFLVSEVPYWNWYNFPADFTAFALVFKLTAWLVAGVVLASLLGSRTATA